LDIAEEEYVAPKKKKKKKKKEDMELIRNFKSRNNNMFGDDHGGMV
jgi:hypothetical protein